MKIINVILLWNIDCLTLNEYINYFIIEFLCQIVRDLKYIKNNKIILKDLNPNNILIYGKNKIKLIDLGLAIDLSFPRNNVTEKEKINLFNQSVSPKFEGSFFYSFPEVMNNELMYLNFDEKLNNNQCNFDEIYEIIIKNLVINLKKKELLLKKYIKFLGNLFLINCIKKWIKY